MGWYPCCCGVVERCNPCDCFPCGVKFKLSDVPSFKCSASYLTDDVFQGEWVYADVTQNTTGSCIAEYVTTIDTQPDITVPPGPPASPPYSCGTCVVSPGILTVRFVITIYGQSNCQPLCNDSEFGGSGVCQFCGFQYDVSIYVEPLIAGSVTQDNEEWNAIAQQEIGPDRCDDYIAEATSRGFPVCPTDPAETYKFQHLNLELCGGGPILDFSDITATLEPAEDERNYLGQDCDGVTAGCACWWQFNPVSPQTPPCTPTTDPSFVNCIDVTFGSSWQNTDWDEDGTIPSTDGWWFTGLDCTDLNNIVVKATEDTAGDFVPCFWSHEYNFTNGTDVLTVRTRLYVRSADQLLMGNSGSCWDAKLYSCTSINSWIQEDVALATYTQNKFHLQMFWSMSPVPVNIFGGQAPVGGRYEWLSQNDFSLANIWTSGAVAANPLKPFQAVAGYNTVSNPSLRSCANYGYSQTMCIFTPVGTITFPTVRPQEMHCKSNHSIPDVTIGPIACPP